MGRLLVGSTGMLLGSRRQHRDAAWVCIEGSAYRSLGLTIRTGHFLLLQYLTQAAPRCCLGVGSTEMLRGSRQH